LTTRPTVVVRALLPERSLTRARRPVGVEAVVSNDGDQDQRVTATLQVPAGMRVLGSPTRTVTVGARVEESIRWEVEASRALYGEVRVLVRGASGPPAEASVPMRFLAPIDIEVPRGYVPEPRPVKTLLLVGAHHCPLWEADKPQMWSQIRKHMERVPALGFYAQENPEVSDWETLWATEHGISFFIYCWYRAKQGGPVEQRFGSAIHQGFFKSRYRDRMRFTIMWENQSRGQAGVADEADLMENLLPFWMENYFKHPSYLKVDNRPVLFIYRPEFLIQDLGSEENVRRAFDKMRQACRREGFDGLYLLGEYRGTQPEPLQRLKRLGLDYSFAYCWPIPNNPTPAQAVAAQLGYIRTTQALAILPQVITLSQAWSGWRDEGTIWKIPPDQYEGLLREGREFAAGLPPQELGSRMVLLDNWNEWGEGHYIAPYTEYGFGYLDAVRRVFGEAAEPHVDVLPEDVGLGPYDTPYRKWLAEERRLRRLWTRLVRKRGAPAGLIGWWAFDEEEESPVALDYSGNRLGGTLINARRAPGVDGTALVCDGGSVQVKPDARLSPRDALSIECWVYSDTPGQRNTWFVNRVYAGGTDTGYRMGVREGKPCFEIPVTSFSHHLDAEMKLPLGRWVHLAGTFDGEVMRLYVDGVLRGTLERRGPVKANDFPLCLGNYDVGHSAYFRGLLDEVRLYHRCLSPEEVATHAHTRP
ncbi:MAG: glycoside hydrolase family 99-like domain-containing protein, partial [Armatimonadota bacterium]|nr:glycoside hydrolase family 99-like domain-containing protein [Armatimonadota bacterium]